jgi:hypothetical protein
VEQQLRRRARTAGPRGKHSGCEQGAREVRGAEGAFCVNRNKEQSYCESKEREVRADKNCATCGQEISHVSDIYEAIGRQAYSITVIYITLLLHIVLYVYRRICVCAESVEDQVVIAKYKC